MQKKYSLNIFDVIKVVFCHPKKLGSSDVWVLEVLSIASLDIQQYLFKKTMKSNACVAMVKPFDVNPLTHLWRTFSTSIMLTYSFHIISSWRNCHYTSP
jgi:hypothetical protein